VTASPADQRLEPLCARFLALSPTSTPITDKRR
jgi:hypothetical protein